MRHGGPLEPTSTPAQKAPISSGTRQAFVYNIPPRSQRHAGCPACLSPCSTPPTWASPLRPRDHRQAPARSDHRRAFRRGRTDPPGRHRATLQCQRDSVREALQRLEAEGLVLFQRNKGAVVTRISEPELAQMFEVRVLLRGAGDPPGGAEAWTRPPSPVPRRSAPTSSAKTTSAAGPNSTGVTARLPLRTGAAAVPGQPDPLHPRQAGTLPAHADEPVRRHAARRPGTPRDRRRLSRRRCRTGRGTDRAHIVGVCRTLYEHLPNRLAST